MKEERKLDLLAQVGGASRIAVGGHIHPDGDCVGAVMAVYLYLRKMLPEADIKAYLEQPAEIFRNVGGVQEICTSPPEDAVPDVFLALDCTKDRLGFSESLFERAGKTINIDHHISNPGCGDVNCIVPEAGATCEILYDVIGKEHMDKEIAEALYIGIIHDTGVFQYSNTSPKTLRIAADLLEYDFPFDSIIQTTFYEKTYEQTQILGKTLSESFRFLDGRCAAGIVTEKDMQLYHVAQKDLDGIVNHLRNIQGIDCAVFLYETGAQKYKVSMRSSGKVDVSRIAVRFGGGGHARAAGCTMRGTAQDIVNSLSLQIAEQLTQTDAV